MIEAFDHARALTLPRRKRWLLDNAEAMALRREIGKPFVDYGIVARAQTVKRSPRKRRES
jgi:hypothetical protein